MNKKYIILGVVLLVIVVLLGVLLPVIFVKDKLIITNYEECVEAGFTVIESNPRLCKTNTGGEFYGPWETVTSRQFTCQVDNDCIPMPSECHPTSCINKEYESTYKTNKELVCTMEFRFNAAYSPEDCLCQENVCVNINLERDSLEE